MVHALASPSNATTNFCNSNTKVSPFTTLSDSALISSPEVIHLSANKQIHLDSVDKTIISTSKLFLGDRNATERVVKGADRDWETN